MGADEITHDTPPQAYHGVYDSFHEPSRHGYIRIYLYFFLFGVLAIGIGVWAMITQNPGAVTAATQSPTISGTVAQINECNEINKNLALFSIVSFAQGGVMLLLGLFLWRFNHCIFWIGTILLVVIYLMVMLAAAAVLAMLFLWFYTNSSAKFCKTAVPALYNSANMFLLVVLGIVVLQVFMGTFFLFYFGLGTATREAGAHLIYLDPEDEPLVN